MMLTNYVAETGVALVEELIDAVKNEQQLQWLMQAVEEKPRGVKRVGKRNQPCHQFRATTSKGPRWRSVK